MGVSESPPLVVKEGGLALPLCPSGWHGLKMVNAFTEAGVDRLLKAINKAHIAKSGSSAELSPWCKVVSFLLAVAWRFRSANISLSSSTNPAHITSCASKRMELIFCVAQGPADPPFI